MAECQWEYIAVTGHSFVHWLKEFVHKDVELDTNLGLSSCKVSFFGKRGGRIRDIDNLMDSWCVPSGSTKAVVMMCGDNDVKKCSWYKESGHCASIVDEIMAEAVELKSRFDADAVIVCQLMPRFVDVCKPYKFDKRYNIKAGIINQSLKEKLCQMEGVFFWTHVTPKLKSFGIFPSNTIEFPKPDKYTWEDGIHMNNAGNFRLYTSLGRALRLRHSQACDLIYHDTNI